MKKTQKQEEEEAEAEGEAEAATVSLITPARRDPKDPRRVVLCRVVSHIVVINVIEWQQQK